MKPERVVVDVDGPTWAETIATLTTPDELDPDDIAILTGWTPSVNTSAEVMDAPATEGEAAVADYVASPEVMDAPATEGDVVVADDVASPEVMDAPATEGEAAVADYVTPEFVPVVEPAAEPPLIEEPVIPPSPALAIGGVVVTGEPGVAEAVSMNPARAFTLWRRRRPRVRKVTRVVRRIDAWSVLKVSVLFYVVLFVILLVAGVLLWNLAESTGTVRNVEGFIRDLFNLEKFNVSGQALFRASWTLGVFLVIAGTGLNVTMAVLFNLISDLVGGIRVTVLEEEVVLAPRAARVTGRRPDHGAQTGVVPPPEPIPVPPVETVDDA